MQSIVVTEWWSISFPPYERNGDAPYRKTDDAIRCWPETATAIAARLSGTRVEVLAPHGVHDLVNLIVRPRPSPKNFDAKKADLALSAHRRYQGGNLDCREIAEGVRNRIRKDDLVTMAHRATGIDDVRNVSFAVGRVGAQ